MDRQKKKTLEAMTSAVLYRETTGGGAQVWRTIAAFDTDVVAERYAAEAAKDTGGEYRVVKFFT